MCRTVRKITVSGNEGEGRVRVESERSNLIASGLMSKEQINVGSVEFSERLLESGHLTVRVEIRRPDLKK